MDKRPQVYSATTKCLGRLSWQQETQADLCKNLNSFSGTSIKNSTSLKFSRLVSKTSKNSLKKFSYQRKIWVLRHTGQDWISLMRHWWLAQKLMRMDKICTLIAFVSGNLWENSRSTHPWMISMNGLNSCMKQLCSCFQTNKRSWRASGQFSRMKVLKKSTWPV